MTHLSINFDNFILYPQHFHDQAFDFDSISYGFKVKDFVQPNGIIVLFQTPLLKNFYEILTKGNGSCFYYSIEKIDCDSLKTKKKFILQKNLENFFSEIKKPLKDVNLFVDNLEDIDAKIEEVKGLSSLKQEEKEKIISFYKDFKYNRIGLGIEISEAIDELKKLGKPAVIHCLPCPASQIKQMQQETGLSLEEIVENDIKESEIKINIDENSNEDEEIHILFRRGHFSRLIDRKYFENLEKWCKVKNVTLILKNLIE